MKYLVRVCVACGYVWVYVCVSDMYEWMYGMEMYGMYENEMICMYGRAAAWEKRNLHLLMSQLWQHLPLVS